jgi:hypothetical protein
MEEIFLTPYLEPNDDSSMSYLQITIYLSGSFFVVFLSLTRQMKE